MTILSERTDASWWTIVRNAAASTFRFTGRSTRTDIAVYWLTVVGLVLVLAIPATIFLKLENLRIFDDVSSLIFALPLPALFFRRLHDAGYSGNWLWLALPGVAMAAARKAIGWAGTLSMSMQFDRIAWPVDWLATLTTLMLVVLLILPGTVGANRFGPDPRGRE